MSLTPDALARRRAFCSALGKDPDSIARRVAARRVPLTQRLESKVSPEPMSGCWLWTGSLSATGYAQLKWERGTKAARAAWFAYRGDPGALHVLHKCDNRACVNPDHLYLGTHQQNMVDRDSRGRGWWQRKAS